MRAEAEDEGEPGDAHGRQCRVNRIRGYCLDFQDIRSMRDMVSKSRGLRLHRRVIPISVPVMPIFGWRAINGNAPGLLHNALCSSDQLEIARIRGSINKIQVAIGHIVSFLHLETTVQKYTVGNG